MGVGDWTTPTDDAVTMMVVGVATEAGSGLDPKNNEDKTMKPTNIAPLTTIMIATSAHCLPLRCGGGTVL